MAATLSISPSTRMLKDFLHETNGNVKSKTASFTSLAIHAVVAAVKRITFPSVKSPGRFLRKRERDEREIGDDFVVKVKDIIRWRSFRDSVDAAADTAAPPLDFADSPDRHTAAATTTTASSSNSSSWCESDFTAEDLSSPSWRVCSDGGGGGGGGGVGKLYFTCVGEDSMNATKLENDRKVNVFSRHEDKEEQSRFDERARRLLEHIKDTISSSKSHIITKHCYLDWLSFEMIRRELTSSQGNEDEEEQMKDTKNITMNATMDENAYEWVLSQKGKETYVREMEREGNWGLFGDEEKVELGLEIQRGIFECLVDEIILDIFQF